MSETLYLVATPIGNLQDISLRALEVLGSVDLIACEDTRRTGKLLKYFDLKKKLFSFHEHNEAKRQAKIIALLEEGKSIAIVSDAGTPCISDPGYGLVAAVRAVGSKVTVIPGPAAFVSAIVLSGLPTDSFYFGGFLPAKTGARKRALREISELRATLVFYESPKRLAASLADCLSVFGARKAAIVREITKIHEETISGDLAEIAQRIKEKPVKGEIVLLIDRDKAAAFAPGDDNESRLMELLKRYEDEGIDRKTSLKRAAKECGYSKPEAYRIVESRKE